MQTGRANKLYKRPPSNNNKTQNCGVSNKLLHDSFASTASACTGCKANMFKKHLIFKKGKYLTYFDSLKNTNPLKCIKRLKKV